MAGGDSHLAPDKNILYVLDDRGRKAMIKILRPENLR